jgi:hypothetical protein
MGTKAKPKPGWIQRGKCPPTPDRRKMPSGLWDVVKDAAGTYRADLLDDEPRSLYGFKTRAEANVASWEDTPECNGDPRTCKAPGHGPLIEVIRL